MRDYLRTERLRLRRITPEDLDNLLALNNDPDVMRYLNGGQPTTRAAVRDEVLTGMLGWYQRGDEFGYWAAEELTTGTFLGWFHFRPPRHAAPVSPRGGKERRIELGYRLHKAAWGRGYATEGSVALIDKGFTELGIDEVYAETMAVNLGSRRVMEKAGLRYVRTFHGDWPDAIPGSEHGEVEYALTRAEWRAAHAHRPGPAHGGA